MLKHRRWVGSAPSLLMLLLVTACTSTPPRIDELVQAREAIGRLQSDPLASTAAALELQAAQGRLRDAELAREKELPVTEVRHLAYLALRQAETGLARLEEAHARKTIADAEAQRTAVQLAARNRELEAARQRAEEARERAERQLTQAEQAREQLERVRRELAELNAKQTERGVVLTLGDVLFDTDRASLKPGARQTLDRLAAFLRDHAETRVMAEGHTDSRGSDAYNQQLSQARANAVTSALVQRGIPADRVSAIGRGEAFPVASNDTAAGRQENRRVEIVFSNESGKFAPSSSG